MKPSLVILAAGIGSRYGGIKQLDSFGPHGEKIIDYTVFDAIQAGFGKIIFVLRKEIEPDFNSLILNKWQGSADFRVVHQELDSIPHPYAVPPGRTKPWGTAHAVWMAEPEISEPFAIVNADDFYGKNSMRVAADFLSKIDTNQHGACLVGYEVMNTLTKFGSVSRGVCQVDEKGTLLSIIERTNISRNTDGTIYFEEAGIKNTMDPGTPVSMNLMGFSPKVFDVIADGFDEIYQQCLTNSKVEYYIPTILNQLIQQGVEVPVISTHDQWFGVTYAEDKANVKEKLAQLHSRKIYPKDLWIR